jgi:hypothetical protein
MGCYAVERPGHASPTLLNQIHIADLVAGCRVLHPCVSGRCVAFLVDSGDAFVSQLEMLCTSNCRRLTYPSLKRGDMICGNIFLTWPPASQLQLARGRQHL